MTDRQLLGVIPYKVFTHPAKIATKAKAKSVNAQLGRLHRTGLVERVPGAACFLYRSRQQGLV